MKSFILFIFIVFFSEESFSQLFYVSKGVSEYFVEFINKDSARIEKFMVRHDYVKLFDEILIRKDKNDSLYKGIKYAIVKDKKDCYLKIKNNKIKLREAENDFRNIIWHKNYLRGKFYKLTDSLSGPFENKFIVDDTVLNYISDKNISYNKYLSKSDKIYDSLIVQILKRTNPMVNTYYKQIDSLLIIDTSKVFNLLKFIEVKYNFPNGNFYSKKVLHEIAIKRPDCLISYLDKNPVNKKDILSIIKEHHKLKEISKGIKAATQKSTNKNLVIKYNRKRKLENLAAGTLYGTIILTEVALVTLFFVWIF